MDWIQKSYDNRKQAQSILLKTYNTGLTYQ